ncbi:unnamed protein product [Lupinus luteus]|uniref:HSF-type DNA-binding domain-containing protein n=1 Tax=Lupinus luteus TaxID=3873 RepID=A0AAV1XG20_LUPLU
MKKHGIIMEEESVGEKSNKSQFVVKTFEIVENPESNEIVSWNETRDSFVVWDVQSFSRNILPTYFRHNNFSSFIRQLHFYGFRKVDSERCEFANEGFKGGMKHLLNNITSKRPKFTKLHKGSSKLIDPNLKDEVEQLKKDNDFLRVEIVKLRQKNENLDNEVSNFRERIRRAELNRNRMIHFIARMDKMKTLVDMLQQEGQEKEQHNKVGTQCQNVEHRQHGIEQLFSLQSEFIEQMSAILKTSKGVNQAGSAIDSTCTENLHDESFDFEGVLKKLLGESSVDGKVHANHSYIDIELEVFLGKSTDWTGFGGEIEEDDDDMADLLNSSLSLLNALLGISWSSLYLLRFPSRSSELSLPIHASRDRSSSSIFLLNTYEFRAMWEEAFRYLHRTRKLEINKDP